MEETLNNNEEIVMKLLHYFITNKGYNPVVLHGAKNEVWLENLDSDYKIIRIVSNYIHNDDQLEFDIHRTNQIMKSIKKKTLSINVPTLSIFTNLGDNVHLEEDLTFDNITCVKLKTLDELVKNNLITQKFPDIKKSLSFKEQGINLFMKITGDINKKTEKDAKQAEDIFSRKEPIVTYTLIVINVIVFILMYFLGNGSEDTATLIAFGANNQYLVRAGQYYRLFTSTFIHIGILHLILNCYALYVIGPQIESFFGKIKFLYIYIGSAICASLLSICFGNYISAGASGALFGLLGALLYFGYHYRLYLGNVIKSQVIPLIILNLVLGFILSGVDNAAHIGGLIGGLFIAMAVGVKYKSKKSERINGIILTAIYVGFLIFLGILG